MKIALLGPASSVHISKISNELQKLGIDNIVISLPNHNDVQGNIKSKVIYLRYGGSKGYYLNASQLKKLLKQENCDILNAHYASGYGNLATLAKFKRTVISVWGSDVYTFPYKSVIHKNILIKVLASADLIFSTSECMKKQTEQFLTQKKEIIVTPFGIDFSSFPFSSPETNNKNFKIGFLKGTDPLYGYDVFLKGLRKLVDQISGHGVKVSAEICGDDYNKDEFFALINALELQKNVNYYGPIPHKEMPGFIKKCDIVCIPSRKESFGVVAIEAMACGRPCVTSNAEGLREVMVDGKTGFVFESENVEECAFLLKKMLISPERIMEMGYTARKHVESDYDFSKNINQFIKGYESLLACK